MAQWPIRVNDQSGVSREHCRSTEDCRHPAGDRVRADIPADVIHQIGFRQAEVRQRRGNLMAGMIADEQQRHGGVRIDHLVRRRVLR